MPRASDITLLLILIQGSIGFINAVGVFDTNYYATPSNSAATYTITDLNNYTAKTDQDISIMDEVNLGIHWMWEALIIGLKIILTVIIVWPTLVYTFGIPAVLATFIQIGIYYYYAIFYAQWKSGKGWKLYD